MVKRLQEYIESHGVPFRVTVHPEAFTAQEIAASTHVSGKVLAKVVMVKQGGKLVMTVLPAACKVSLDRLRQVLGGEEVTLAKEGEFSPLFPDCEKGAMPPFGNLYSMDVFVDEEISRQADFVFQAGSHREVVTIPYKDFARLVGPRVAEFCAHG